MTLRIANGAGFLGDRLDAPRQLVESAEVDYLTLEYLAELTLSILARIREKNPQAGYAADLVEVVQSLAPALREQAQLRVVTNGGGMNPLACAAAVGQVLSAAGLPELPIAAVTGDDLLGKLAELKAAGCELANLDTGQPLAELLEPVVSANAYLGACPMVEALSGDARLVITGRVADASLTLGPAVHRFGWAWDDWNRLAAGSVAGHLIECGAQVTGAYSTAWRDRDLTDVGYPIAELSADGSCVVAKPAGSGGVVNRRTVIEQLLYEIGDPRHYLTPDVDVDFTTVEVATVGENRVQVSGATGHPPPETLKVSLAYRAGFTASSQLLVYGHDCVEKAKACAEMIFARVRQAGFSLERTHVELLGAGAGVPGAEGAIACTPCEVMLRMSVHDANQAAVTRFTREVAPLITSGPAGLAGYAVGRSSVRPVFAYWPTLIPRDLAPAVVTIQTAEQWSAQSHD